MPNYRKVYKSDHLGVVDLEEMIEQKQSLKLVIKHVKQEIGVVVAGNKGNHNIAYFVENIKPWVLNAGNAGIIKGFTKSTDTDNWNNVSIELFIDENVKMKGQIVGGIRIKPIQPQIAQSKRFFTEANFEKAKSANASIEQIKASYELTEDMETKYNDYVGAA